MSVHREQCSFAAILNTYHESKMAANKADLSNFTHILMISIPMFL